MGRYEDEANVRGRSRSRSPIGSSRDVKHDDRRRNDDRDSHKHHQRRRSKSRSRSRHGKHGRSRSRSNDRQRDRRRSRSPRRRSRSRSGDRSESAERDRQKSHRHGRRRSRSRPSERSRSRDKDRKHRSRKRDRSSSNSEDESDEEYRRRRKERKKEKEARRKEKKREKKEKKKHGNSAQWGKYGIISESDIFNKSSEFYTWLVEERKINPETISKDQNRKEFAKFVEDYNTATLPHEKYYNMEAFERRMTALRSGELLPPTEDSYDPNADMKALKSAHKRRVVDHESYLSKEQLQELRKVQNERIEASKMKLLGMDVKQNMGVRMDGVGFD